MLNPSQLKQTKINFQVSNIEVWPMHWKSQFDVRRYYNVEQGN